MLAVLILGLGCFEAEQGAFGGAVLGVPPDSLLTPYLVACWLHMVLRGLRRAHGSLSRFYDLGGTPPRDASPWQKLKAYLLAWGWKAGELRPGLWASELLGRFSRPGRQFLFGTPSQMRR